MTSKQLRERLIYIAMSVFVGWHTIAILVAPMPRNSEMVQSLRRLFEPYLTLFRLDHEWGYFSPVIGKWPQLQYVIEDAAGQRHTFVPVDEVSWFHPLYRRLGYWYGEIMGSPDTYADFAAQIFCRKHAALTPVSVTLMAVAEYDYWPDDRLQGKQPRDSDYVTVNTLKTVECQN